MHSQQSVPNGGSPESPMMLPGFDRNSLSQVSPPLCTAGFPITQSAGQLMSQSLAEGMSAHSVTRQNHAALQSDITCPMTISPPWALLRFWFAWQMEGGWPDDSIGRASDGGALCSGHASLHVQPRTESKVDVRSRSLLTFTLFPYVPSRNTPGL